MKEVTKAQLIAGSLGATVLAGVATLLKPVAGEALAGIVVASALLGMGVLDLVGVRAKRRLMNLTQRGGAES